MHVGDSAGSDDDDDGDDKEEGEERSAEGKAKSLPSVPVFNFGVAVFGQQ